MVQLIQELTTTSEVSGTGKFQNLASTGGFNRLKSSEFLSGIYNEERMTPHREMQESQKAYRQHPFIVTATRLLTNALLGRGITVETDDAETRQYFEQSFLSRLKEPLREAAEQYVVSGNGYIHRKQAGNTIQFETIARAEKIFIDYTGGFNPTRFILQVPRSVVESYDEADTFKINYVDRKKRVHGVPYKPDEIMHFKQGTSHVPVYGRSGLASASDDLKILRELMRDAAIIARYKAIPKKLWKLSQDGRPVSDDAETEWTKYMNSLGDWENPVAGSLDVEFEDLSHQNTVEMIEPLMERLKQQVTAVLGPNFYLNGDVTNYAVAQEQKNSFFLMVEAMRDDFRKPVNEAMQDEARMRGLDENVTIQFGDFDFPTREQRVKEALQAFKAGNITINEAREGMDMETLPEAEEGGVGDAFSWEVKQQDPLGDAVQQQMDGLPDPVPESEVVDGSESVDTASD